MNKTPHCPSACILILAIALTVPLNLFADGSNYTVSSVTDTSITLVSDQDSPTYTITGSTSIIVNGQPDTLQDIQAGMFFWVQADSSGNAIAIYANTPPAHE